jgi:hypothetical protein
VWSVAEEKPTLANDSEKVWHGIFLMRIGTRSGWAFIVDMRLKKGSFIFNRSLEIISRTDGETWFVNIRPGNV